MMTLRFIYFKTLELHLAMVLINSNFAGQFQFAGFLLN